MAPEAATELGLAEEATGSTRPLQVPEKAGFLPATLESVGP